MRLPPCPVLRAWSRSVGLGSPDLARQRYGRGGVCSACLTRPRIVTGESSRPPASKRTALLWSIAQLQGVLDGNDALALGEQLDQGIEQGRLARAGASRNQDVVTALQGVFRISASSSGGNDPILTRSAAEKLRPPKRRTGDRDTSGEAGGTQTATREPSASRASMVGVLTGSSDSGRQIWRAARIRAAPSRSGAG